MFAMCPWPWENVVTAHMRRLRSPVSDVIDLPSPASRGSLRQTSSCPLITSTHVYHEKHGWHHAETQQEQCQKSAVAPETFLHNALDVLPVKEKVLGPWI